MDHTCGALNLPYFASGIESRGESAAGQTFFGLIGMKEVCANELGPNKVARRLRANPKFLPAAKPTGLCFANVTVLGSFG